MPYHCLKCIAATPFFRNQKLDRSYSILVFADPIADPHMPKICKNISNGQFFYGDSTPNPPNRCKISQRIRIRRPNDLGRVFSIDFLEKIKKIASAGDDLKEIGFCARFARAWRKLLSPAGFSYNFNKKVKKVNKTQF